MTPQQRAALLAAVAAVCVESMRLDATGETVIVRYPDYTREAVIRQSRDCCGWHIVKYVDRPAQRRERLSRNRVIKKQPCKICGRLIGAIAPNVERHYQKHIRRGEA